VGGIYARKTVKEQIRLDKRRFPRSIFLTRGQRYSPLAAFRVQTQNKSYLPSTGSLTLYRSRNVPNLLSPILVALLSKTRRSAHQYRTELLCNLSYQYSRLLLIRLILWQGSLHRFSSRSAELMTYWEAVHDIPSTQDVSRGGRLGGLVGGHPRAWSSAACLSRRSACQRSPPPTSRWRSTRCDFVRGKLFFAPASLGPCCD
jgi:hypothetical protein